MLSFVYFHFQSLAHPLRLRTTNKNGNKITQRKKWVKNDLTGCATGWFINNKQQQAQNVSMGTFVSNVILCGNFRLQTRLITTHTHQPSAKICWYDLPWAIHGNMGCMRIKQHDAPSNFCHRRPMWHQRNLHRPVDFRMLMWYYFGSYSIVSKNAVCQPFWFQIFIFFPFFCYYFTGYFVAF